LLFLRRVRRVVEYEIYNKMAIHIYTNTGKFIGRIMAKAMHTLSSLRPSRAKIMLYTNGVQKEEKAITPLYMFPGGGVSKNKSLPYFGRFFSKGGNVPMIHGEY
jgi:hypothetical protein